MAVVHFEEQDYNFDIEDLSLSQARSIFRQTGLTVKGLMDGLNEMDPEALAALYWLMLAQNGTVTDINKVNFKVMKFAEALGKAFEDEVGDAEDPTAGEQIPAAA